MPRGLFDRIVAGSEIRYFSDIYRYAALYEHGGLWMDSDVVLLGRSRTAAITSSICNGERHQKRPLLCGNVMDAEPFSRHLRTLYEASIDRFFASPGWEFGDVGPKLLSDYVASDAGAELRDRLFSPVLFNPIDWTEIDPFERPISRARGLSQRRSAVRHPPVDRAQLSGPREGRRVADLPAVRAARLPSEPREPARPVQHREEPPHRQPARLCPGLRSAAFRPALLAKGGSMEIGLCRGLAERNQTETPSVALWQTYFPFCEVIGLDLTHFSSLNNDRFTSFVCDQSKRDDLRAVAAKLEPGSLDVIIDDGSHASFDQQLTLRELFPR